MYIQSVLCSGFRLTLVTPFSTYILGKQLRFMDERKRNETYLMSQ